MKNIRKIAPIVVFLSTILTPIIFAPNIALASVPEDTPASEISSHTLPGQKLTVPVTVEPATVTRDSYTVTAAPPPPPPVVVPASAKNRYVAVKAPSQPYSGQAVIDYARQFVGKVPYGMGDTPSTSFSCDGFVQYVMAGFGITLPRGAGNQAARGTIISKAAAQPGDLVWYPGQHIAFYAGNNTIIDSPNWGRYVEEHHIWGNPVFIRM